MKRDTVTTIARLARWLGPWTSEERRPRSIARETVEVATSAEGDRPPTIR